MEQQSLWRRRRGLRPKVKAENASEKNGHLKLTGFENWSQWSRLTRLKMIESSVWDIIDGGRAKIGWKSPETQLETQKDIAAANLLMIGQIATLSSNASTL